MSCFVSVDLSGAKEDEISDENRLQFVPAKISYDGEAKVGTYMTEFTTTEDATGLQHTAFRGRPLDGRQIKMPKGYSAFVVEGGDGGGSLGDSSEESHEVKMSAVGSRHRQVTVWNWDKAGAPDHDNPVSKAFQWLDIADTVADGGFLSDEEEDENEKENDSKKRKHSDAELQ